jgi:hypothetical protein
MACNLTIIDQAGNHIIKVCGQAPGQGQGAVGAACQVDGECRSDTCLNGRCAGVCCTDSDCAGLRCLVHNVGDQQNPILVNLCQ